jgi:hypothetical protein
MEVFINEPLKIYKVGLQIAKEFDYAVHPPLFSYIGCEKKKVVWFYGASGAGKTCGAERLHNKMFPNDAKKLCIFDASKDEKWWTNIHPTFKTVIVNNVHSKTICTVLHLLISLAQGSFCTGEVKGKSISVSSELICLTSIEHPKILYNTMSQIDKNSNLNSL